MNRPSLIHGVTGQTGAYLARRLLQSGRTVIGTTRPNAGTGLWRLERLGIADDIDIVPLDAHSGHDITRLLEKIQPATIFNLSGPSSVGASFADPIGTVSKIYDPVANFLESLHALGSSTRFINAASTECFGNQSERLLAEESPMNPVSPYGTGKTTTYWATRNARSGLGVNASNAILTNHESPLRGPEFVTHKIIAGLRDIARESGSALSLGNTSVVRDWLWADDVAQALILIADARDPDDYLVASGSSHSLDELIDVACRLLKLNPLDVITHDPSLYRPSEIERVSTNPSKILNHLGWRASVRFPDIIERLVTESL